MEEVFEVVPALIVLFVSIVVSVVGSQKNKQKAAAKRQLHTVRPHPAKGVTFAGPAAPSAPASVPSAAPMARPLDRPPLTPKVSAMQAESMAGEAEIMPGADEVYQPAQTQVHDHLAPACPEHEDDGSLDYASPEGIDPCHEEDLRGMNTPLAGRPVAASAPSGFRLKLDAEDLTQAFVLQEVLKRPQDRRRRR